MSLIKSVLQQLGLSSDPAKNFTLGPPAVPDGTMKLARGNAGATTQDIMTVDAAGKVGFSVGVLGFVYASSGNGKSLKLPSWLGNIAVQWGIWNFSYTGTVQTHSWTLPVPLVDFQCCLCKRMGLLSTNNTPAFDEVLTVTSTQGNLSFVGGSSGNASVSWLIIGVAA